LQERCQHLDEQAQMDVHLLHCKRNATHVQEYIVALPA